MSPEFFTPMSWTLDKNFLLLSLAESDVQTIVNGQRVCNCRFRRLLARASNPRETIWNSIKCVDPWVLSFFETSWSSSIVYDGDDKAEKLPLLFSQLIPWASPLGQGFQAKDDLLQHYDIWEESKGWECYPVLQVGYARGARFGFYHIARSSWYPCPVFRVLLP